MLKKTILTLSILAINSTSFAQTPNAGTISRDASTTAISPIAVIPTLTTAQPTTPPTTDKPATQFVVSQINLTGANLIPSDKLNQLIAKEQGKTHTLASLQRLANTITQYYQQQGYPLAVAILPPQKIENGNVTIQIVEGKIGNITINNQSRIKDSIAQSYLSHAKDNTGTLSQPKAERAMSLVRDLAGVDYVGYQLTEGKRTGESDLLVNLGKAKAIDGGVTVDNYGSKSTGEVRTRANLNINSPFGYGEKISLEGMSSFKGVNYARIGATLPTGSEGTKIYTNLSRTTYDLGGDFKDLDATGTANTASLGVNYPIKRSNNNSLWLDSNLQYSDLTDKVGATKTTTDKTNKAVNIGLNGYSQDNLLGGGYTQYGITNTLGNLSIDSADARAMDAVSAKTHGNYYKLAGYLNRTQFFNQKWSLLTGINGQWANKNLDSSEQLSIGGVNGVSAYHSNDVSADEGIIGQAELRYRFNPNLMVSGFYEAGSARLRHDPYTTADNTISLQGVGLGLYGNYKNINLESKVSWRTSDEKFSNDKSPRVWVKAGYNF